MADAIVDRTLCVRAKWFVGWPGSTFSNQITLSRHYALGTNASNYYYNARGVFPRLDDGRLIRDAYDRRERPGKKWRGPDLVLWRLLLCPLASRVQPPGGEWLIQACGCITGRFGFSLKVNPIDFCSLWGLIILRQNWCN